MCEIDVLYWNFFAIVYSVSVTAFVVGLVCYEEGKRSVI